MPAKKHFLIKHPHPVVRRLEIERRRLDATCEEMAARLEVSQSVYSKWLRGDRNPEKGKALVLLARSL